MNSPFFRLWRLLWLLPILLCSVGMAEAVVLGKMTVLSGLGSHFEAEVPLLDVSAANQPLAECFHLGQRGQTDENVGVALLTRGRVSIEQRGAGLRLYIVSDQVINEPVLQVNVHAGCGAEVVRKYLLLIDPPLARKPAVDLPAIRAAAVPEPEQVSRSRPVTGLQFGDTRQVLPAVRPVATPGAGAAGDTPYSFRPERPLPRKASPGSGAIDRLLLSGGTDRHPSGIAGDLPLRLSTRPSVQLMNKMTESQRSMLRIEYQLLSALHTQAEQQLAVAEQVRRLDATLNDLQRKNLGQGRQQTLVAAAIPASSPVQPATTPTRMAAPPVAPVTENTDWWLEAGLLLGLIAGLTWLFRRRSGNASGLSEIAESTFPPENFSEAVDRNRQPIQIAERPVTVAEDESRGDALLIPGGVTSGLVTRDDDEVTAVLQLAEIMISFGRVTGAAQVLEEFLEQKPTLAVTPWLKLLEVYRQNEQREAFEALGLQLKRHFNVAAADWESAGELVEPVFAASDEQSGSIEQLLVRLPRVGQLPHIKVMVTRTWGSPDCLAYLHRLLRDNRDGERRGFPLGTARELLFLIDLLENRLARQN
ncbi:MAG TPA: hypothetical protein PKZ67_01820 [Accumulibacter sp.]|uniref:Tfp pilus assembly protein FimV n=1 Tax=Candidatus Accumulibacter cognatus TaxID=2954383 RepID=A0A080M1R2_9PROT|nr:MULTISPECIES: hypothetical protein [Candidatus Accumulibacter]MCC2866660.1 hypothetical protein [Candidatus Accumulibacter phosphatis]KFB75198.1 MAG: Tfp pilus assembly protein FimV [Candidatus Accumulibacter cognatus]MBN8517021.1 hypothetical protein [Accumulibacter sp.]MBO3709795.1 hypothetical protein [Accumulibacter sp.]MCM8578162.1 hypothetical protein [Accumulibacter sp.]